MEKSLDKIRDELAESYDQFKGKAVTFKAGFEAAIQALTEAAGAFDEKAAEATRHSTDRDYWVDGARWQFDADAKRIGLAEQDRDSWKSNNNILREAANKHIAELEARLAESEAHGSADLIAERDRYRERVEELSQLLKDKGIR